MSGVSVPRRSFIKEQLRNCALEEMRIFLKLRHRAVQAHLSETLLKIGGLASLVFPHNY